VSKIEGRFVKIVKDINPKNDMCESSSSSSSSYSPGVIAGIVIGSLVLVALIVALIIFLIRKLSVSNTDYKIEMTKI
jgi:hypothetical protein